MLNALVVVLMCLSLVCTLGPIECIYLVELMPRDPAPGSTHR